MRQWDPSRTARKQRALAHATVWVLGVLGLPPPALALRLQLRARTQLHVAVVPAGAEVEVRGTLEDTRNRPVVDAAVTVAVVGSPPPVATHGERDLHTVVTGPTGAFSLRVPIGAWLGPDRLVHAEASFAGSPELGDATAETLFDLQKQDATLDIRADPQQLRTDGGDVALTAELRSGDLPLAGLELTWAVDGTSVVVSRSDGDGVARATLPATALGEPGPHRITAELVENPQVNPAAAALHVELIGAVQVELAHLAGDQPSACRSAGAELAAGDWCLQGRVRTVHRGKLEPSHGAAVTLHLAKQLMASLTTDASGRFFAVVRGQALARLFPPGPVALVARAILPAPWHEVGWSPVMSLDLPPPPQLAGWLYAIPAAALLVGLWLERWRNRRRERALQAWQEAASAGLPEAQVRSLRPGQPSCRLQGRVSHGETGRDCAARLALTQRETGTEVRTEWLADGRFDWGEQPPGRYTLLVEATDHMPLHLHVDMPHDGLFDGCELLPASCRAVVRGNFSTAVRAWTQRPVDWGSETPREVEPRVVAAIRRGHADLRDAVRRVERALYGRSTQVAQADAARAALARVEEAQ